MKINTITTPKDKRWYAFRWRCDLHEHSSCNLYSPEEMHWCLRPDRKGNPRPKYEPVSCKVNVCPVLKGKIKMNADQIELLS